MYRQQAFPLSHRLSAQPEDLLFSSICPLVFDQRAFFLHLGVIHFPLLEYIVGWVKRITNTDFVGFAHFYAP
jgi:hypothetical protein